MPLLPAKQRDLAEGDWLAQDSFSPAAPTPRSA